MNTTAQVYLCKTNNWWYMKQWSYIYIYDGKSVDDVAFRPDLSLVAGEHADGGHLGHGDGEVVEEVAVVPAGGGLQHVGPGEAVVQEGGVWPEQAAPPGHVSVVAGVEGDHYVETSY